MRRASKQRYETAGGRIRALYGHSLPGKLVCTPATPPAELFHGTCIYRSIAIPRTRSGGARRATR